MPIPSIDVPTYGGVARGDRTFVTPIRRPRMSLVYCNRLGRVLVAAMVAACAGDKDAVSPQRTTLSPGTPSFSAGLGSTSTLLGRATFRDASPTFKIKRITGDWHVEVKAVPALDVRCRRSPFNLEDTAAGIAIPDPSSFKLSQEQ